MKTKKPKVWLVAATIYLSFLSIAMVVSGLTFDEMEPPVLLLAVAPYYALVITAYCMREKEAEDGLWTWQLTMIAATAVLVLLQEFLELTVKLFNLNLR